MEIKLYHLCVTDSTLKFMIPSLNFSGQILFSSFSTTSFYVRRYNLDDCLYFIYIITIKISIFLIFVEEIDIWQVRMF